MVINRWLNEKQIVIKWWLSKNWMLTKQWFNNDLKDYLNDGLSGD